MLSATELIINEKHVKIGIIGAGAIGRAFATQAVRAGYEVVLSNRHGPASLAPLVAQLGGRARAGTVAEAAQAEVVFLALPWEQVAPVAASVSSWEGRLVIDPTNPILLPGFRLAELGGRPSSEVVAGLVPGARVVKAFNTLMPAVLAANPREAGGQRVIFYSGNDSAAKATVAGLLQQMGFAGIDLGLLHEGGKLQQFPGGPLPTLNLLKVA
ncbi:NADPH-dependent F420 reductase [Hymenobacter norwichensis]|uniref:NADPH-dependent F420 reductase n=1 Tax=Hymenobacter norwichensis TaxID=223903 RepID=UPI003CCBF24F